MGYTNYFTQQREITDKEWSLIENATKEVLILCDQRGINLAYDFDYPKRPPYVSGTEIRFNGVGDEGHETFHIDRLGDKSFNFCKTARKPYDEAVVAVLSILHHYAPGGWDIGSDGNCEDWQDGLIMAQQAIAVSEVQLGLAPPIECPVKEQDDED